MLRSLLVLSTLLAAPLGDPVLKDSDLKSFGQTLRGYIDASIAREKVLEAEADVQKEMEKLAKKLKKAPVADILGLPADLGRSIWLSYEYGKQRVSGGSVENTRYEGAPFSASAPLEYAILAPAAYDKGKARSWPLVLTLPDEGETPSDHILRNWEDAAFRDGVILAAPKMPADRAAWTSRDGVAAVLVLMRAVYESWAVDFNQIYLAGRGASVEAALFVAGQFPDRFAGVIGRAGDAGQADPANFCNLPTWFAGGGAGVTAWEKSIKELGYENCTTQPEGREAEILRWMSSIQRPSMPGRVVLVPGKPFPTRSAWVAVDPGDEAGARVEASVDRASNTITIDAALVPRVTLYFNDDLVDLSRPVKVVINGTESVDELPRSFRTFLTLLFRGTSDPGRAFVASKTYSVPSKSGK